MADDRDLRQQELARLLLQKARQDLTLVENVWDAKDIADEIVGFHVQQVVEKTLKGVLTRLGIEYGYTHDLSVLYQQVENAGLTLPTELDAVDELTIFAVQFRYTLFEEQSLNRKAGINLAQQFIEWGQRLIELA